MLLQKMYQIFSKSDLKFVRKSQILFFLKRDKFVKKKD